ncbi:MAG: hypothetical protein JXA18_15140 [Chitinispirillaceae bacterium]|nr:hypothetical protein [Chitinispirillaceae bacterium]
MLFVAVVFFFGIRVYGADLILTLTPDDLHQTIRHFGSSAAFDLNEITDSWSEEGRELLAESIFSREIDSQGNPRGLGLSSFRIEIGGCSRQQGSGSRISMESRRAPCPLLEDGSYDWTRMEAETYWVDKAYEYGVDAVFGYSNSPPVYFTKNGLACRTEDVPSANLKEECYDDFAEYLAQVALYYADRNTPLHFISPVNEPQWEWICDNQEGSMWLNTEIRDLVIAMDTVFRARNVSTKVTIPEGGSIDRIYGFSNDPTGDQLRFWEPDNSLYIGDLEVLAPYVAGHGYWTEDTDQRLVTTRQNMLKRIRETDDRLEWWQSEYSFLGDGYLDGRSNLAAVDYGLFLAKVIHHDLTLGNASGWQYWETFGRRGTSLRYMLVQTSNQECSPAKTGWALGHYSFFIRPGMKRIGMTRSDSANPLEAADGILPSAYLNQATGDLVIVVVNYEDRDNTIKLNLPDLPRTTPLIPYLTTGSESMNMARQTAVTLDDDILLPARSITTLVADSIENLVAIEGPGKSSPGSPLLSFKVRQWEKSSFVFVDWKGLEPVAGRIELVDVKGRCMVRMPLAGMRHQERIPLPEVTRGVYYLRVSVNNRSFHKTVFIR